MTSPATGENLLSQKRSFQEPHDVTTTSFGFVWCQQSPNWSLSPRFREANHDAIVWQSQRTMTSREDLKICTILSKAATRVGGPSRISWLMLPTKRLSCAWSTRLFSEPFDSGSCEERDLPSAENTSLSSDEPRVQIEIAKEEKPALVRKLPFWQNDFSRGIRSPTWKSDTNHLSRFSAHVSPQRASLGDVNTKSRRCAAWGQ